MGWKHALTTLAAVAVLAPLNFGTALAGEFVGLDPYNRPVFAPSVNGPAQPLTITGPHYQRRSGQIGGPVVAGPLFFAAPVAGTDGLYRTDPMLQAGAVIGFDVDNALAAAAPHDPGSPAYSQHRPAPFTAEWMRSCEMRYRSFDRDTGTYQPNVGPRRLCR